MYFFDFIVQVRIPKDKSYSTECRAYAFSKRPRKGDKTPLLW